MSSSKETGAVSSSSPSVNVGYTATDTLGSKSTRVDNHEPAIDSDAVNLNFGTAGAGAGLGVDDSCELNDSAEDYDVGDIDLNAAAAADLGSFELDDDDEDDEEMKRIMAKYAGRATA